MQKESVVGTSNLLWHINDIRDIDVQESKGQLYIDKSVVKK